jgi:hypothetical protein
VCLLRLQALWHPFGFIKPLLFLFGPAENDRCISTVNAYSLQQTLPLQHLLLRTVWAVNDSPRRVLSNRAKQGSYRPFLVGITVFVSMSRPCNLQCASAV